MNYGIVLKVLGSLLIVESILMVPSYIIALVTSGKDKNAFLIAIILTMATGLILSFKKGIKAHIRARDGLAIVTFGWILSSIFGAIPLYMGGSTKTYIDALFETVSGFTTTGATILSEVETLPMGTIFWRSFTHWIGGMGILVFTLALLPALGIEGFQIFKAESPGPVAGKIAPKLKDTAKILYMTYLILTLIQIALLILGGMGIFDSLVHTFGTVGTGGLSSKNLSIGHYNSSYIHVIIGIFMMLSGINFSLYYGLYKGKGRLFFKDEELRLYLAIIAVSVVAISLNLLATSYERLSTAFRDSFFQVSSIITTTGYSTVDFDMWPSFSKGILFMLMFIGGSAGSTSGGIKVIRVLVWLKLIKREINKLFHPRAVIPIKVNGRVMPDETIAGINSFIALYIIIFIISSLLVALEGVDLISASTSVAATLSNIGPGLEMVGPMRNFGDFSQITKLLFISLMLLGRLELFTMIALFAPRT
ncbi:MAG: TrkH family potassium uptake protein [Clostridiales bacterium]|nr:TrkH family potassium uptake protein [Clostridiales bacterium]